jgi:excinuclease ABC subunit C
VLFVSSFLCGKNSSSFLLFEISFTINTEPGRSVIDTEKLKEKASNFPTDPGVYLFKDIKGKVIYVGKALNLRKRISSYFLQLTHPEPKIDSILVNANDVDYVITQTEMEALVVESNLVKRYKPRYNARLKDDKSYPYLKITVRDKYPKVIFTRKIINDGARYYGPLSSPSVHAAIYTLKNTFRLCGCKLDLSKTYRRACLDYQIKRCMGPCIGAVTEFEYKRVVKDAMAFLEGKSDKILERLKEDMIKASDHMDFEKAAFIRDQVKNIEKFILDQRVISGGMQNEDFLGFARKGGHAIATVFMVRGSKLVGKENFIMLAPVDDSDRIILSSFFNQYYNMNQSIPQRINIPFNLDDEPVLASWLKEKRGKRVIIKLPDRGERRRLTELASQNASLQLDDHLTKESTAEQLLKSALEEIQKSLNLKNYPNRIECYDISNLGRDNISKTAVASRVVFIDGKPSKEHYRRFRIKTVSIQDDYAMMEEVLTRRLKKYKSSENQDSEKIDLIIIDGGKGHLSVARRVAQNLGLTELDLAALAKREEEIFRPDEQYPVILPKGSPELFLMQRIRNEAHRFANEYQRHLRSKLMKASILDDIPGLGPKRKEELIRRFKSVERIKKLTLEEISSVPGITLELANTILEKLNSNQDK